MSNTNEQGRRGAAPNQVEAHAIDLRSPFSLSNSFRYPVQNALARKEVLIGALLLLVPIVGWLLNMGHRIEMVHNMQHGRCPWPAWRNFPRLLKSGVVTFLGMVYYYLPGAIAGFLAWYLDQSWLYFVAAPLAVAATIAIPGYMTHYCYAFDAAEIFNPVRALGRTIEGGRAYWKAWAIVVPSLVLSFVGLAAFGLGFLVTSVWFWQVAGFSFACVFSNKYRLLDKTTRN